MADGGKLIVKIDGDNSGFQKATGNLSKIGSAALKGLAIGAAAVGAAIVAIGTSAIKSYADYEQLVGGVDTLFKESSQTIQGYAANAYKTAGLSANEYMSTVTSFSASLLQSLDGDTQKSAEYANQAVTDMSDNANKMGTSMEMIQNAYQGFAKQNYTMLDNLKLGYGGTKEEMSRLLENAGKISGIEYDISSFADVTEAIHVMQQEMGIAGTTATEASSTIQGSLGMLKGAWENLMTGLSDPEQDIGVLIDNVFNSLVTVAENLIPRITQVLSGIGSVITELVPPLLQAITDMIPVLLPVIVDGVVQIANALVGAFPVIINALLSQLPSIIQAGLDIIIALAMGLTQYLPELIPAVVDAVITIVETLIDNIDMLIDAAIAIILALADGLIKSLPTLIEKIPEIVIKLVDALVANAPKLVMAALQLIIALGTGLIQAIPTLIKNIPQILEAMFNALTVGLATMMNIGKQLVEGLWKGITNAKDWLLNKIKGFAKSITQGIKDFFGIESPSKIMRDEVGLMITKGIAVGIDEGKSEVEKAMNKMNKRLLESEIKYLEEFEKAADEIANSSMSMEDMIKFETPDYSKLLRAERKYVDDMIDYNQKQRTRDNEKAERENRQKYEKALSEAETEADKERALEQYNQNEFTRIQELAYAEESRMRERREYELKKSVDAERKLYEALAKDLENIAAKEDTLADKLKARGKLYETVTVRLENDETLSYVSLGDLKAQTKANEDFTSDILKLQDRGGVPQQLIDEILGESLDEGSAFTKALLKADDTTFNDYISAWIGRQAGAAAGAEAVYADETAAIVAQIPEDFKNIDGDLADVGKDNASAWADGFMSKLKETLPSVIEQINGFFSSAFNGASGSLAIAGGGAGATYSNTYVIQPSPGESTRDQLDAIENKSTLDEMRGGY